MSGFRIMFVVFATIVVMTQQCNGVEETMDNWRQFVNELTDSSHQKRHHEHFKEEPLIIDLSSVDPCQNVSCPRGEICIAHKNNEARCIPNEEITADFMVDRCIPCHTHHHHAITDPVCGEDGQRYESLCELEYYSCLLETFNRAMCEGDCPCQTMQEIPEPRGLHVTSLPDAASSHVEVLWQAPLGFETKGEVNEYILRYTRVGGKGWTEVRAPGDVHKMMLAGLVPNSEYYFRIQAVVTGVEGNMSDAAFYITGPLHSQIENELESDTEWGDIVDDEDASGDHSNDS